MSKKHDITDEDIAKQRYKGASPVVAGLGEGVIQTKFLLAAGLVAGGVAAFVRPKEATAMIGDFNKWLKTMEASPNKLKQLGAKPINMFLNFGREFADIIVTGANVVTDAGVKHGVLNKNFKRISKATSDKVEIAIEGAIVASTATSFLGALVGGSKGVSDGRRGKKQFETAKDEIVDLRKRLVDKDAEIDDLKTAHAAKKGTLKVASDEPSTHNTHSEMLGEKPKASWTAEIKSQNEAKAESQLSL